MIIPVTVAAFFWVGITLFLLDGGKSIEPLGSIDVSKQLEQERQWIKEMEMSINVRRDVTERLMRQHLAMLKPLLLIDSGSDYLQNILNLFSLAHRLCKVWPVIMALLDTISDASIRRPTFNPTPLPDLWSSAMRGLVRLQQVYNITPEELLGQQMDGAHPLAHFTGGDCFDLGQYYYRLHHYGRSVEWLRLALSTTRQDHSVSRETVMELLHLALCFNGDRKGSAKIYRLLQLEFPHHIPSLALLSNHTAMTTNSCRKISLVMNKIVFEDTNLPHVANYTRGLCCKERYRPPDDSRLRCRYLHYSSPYLMIGPFKMEELHLDPPILLVHEALYDSEIDHFKTMYHNKTKPARADYDDEDDEYQDLQYNLWLKEGTHDQVNHRLTERSARITNLGLYQVEETMLANYGLAAEIKPHKDLGLTEKIFVPGSRRDYLTLMYYMNDVDEGGFTIFPDLDLALRPQKGVAVLWFNRFPDWSAIEEMKHMGCPILRGNKWILVKWFHPLGQDFPKCVPGKEQTYKYYYMLP